MRRRNIDGPVWVFAVFWFLTALLSLAWAATLIWGVIYVVTHLDGWLN